MAEINKKALKHTTSTSAPTVNFDITLGYSVNSPHTQTEVDGGVIVFICNDVTEGAAVWVVVYGNGVDATIITVHGKSDAAIAVGKVVYPSGVQGDFPEFSIANNQAHHHITGLAKNATTGIGQDIETIIQGLWQGFDTSAFAPGTVLHHNSTGDWQSAIPTSGYHTHIGIVIKQGSGSSGSILIGIDQIVHSVRAAAGQDLDIGLGGASSKLGYEKFTGVEFAKMMEDGFYIDNIEEHTSDAGVTIDGVLIKDGVVFGKKALAIQIHASDVDLSIQDAVAGITIDALYNGWKIIDKFIKVNTPGGTSGTTDVQIRRQRGAVMQDILTVKMTLSVGEYIVDDGTINTSYELVTTGDMFFPDTDALNAIPPQGLTFGITLEKQ